MSWMGGWLNTMMVYLQMVTYLTVLAQLNNNNNNNNIRCSAKCRITSLM